MRIKMNINFVSKDFKWDEKIEPVNSTDSFSNLW